MTGLFSTWRLCFFDFYFSFLARVGDSAVSLNWLFMRDSPFDFLQDLGAAIRFVAIISRWFPGSPPGGYAFSTLIFPMQSGSEIWRFLPSVCFFVTIASVSCKIQGMRYGLSR
jgi:hypothetical protein